MNLKIEVSNNSDVEKIILGNVSLDTLLCETIFNLVAFGEGMSKSDLLYELKDYIEYTQRGWEEELFNRKNIFEITRRGILHLIDISKLEGEKRRISAGVKIKE